jgi:hypothetical protein
MGGLGEKQLHLIYGKLKPSMIQLPLLNEISCGIVYQDLLVIGERSTLEIV